MPSTPPACCWGRKASVVPPRLAAVAARSSAR